MAQGDGGMTRRRAIVSMAGGAAAAVLVPRLAAAANGTARVVRVESGRVWNGDQRDAAVVAAMVDRGVQALTGEATAAAAWRRYFKAGMRVGLKINLLGRPLIYTAPEVTRAVAAGAIGAGVAPADVVVWDRWRDHFGPTAYRFGRGALGERVEASAVYDRKRALQSSGGPCPIDTMAVDRTDVTVNLPVLKDHGGAGVTLALKNIAFGCYDHHGRAHDNACDPYIAEACEHFYATVSSPLIVLDATEACCDGGPRPGDRGRLWRENAIYLATDPVALDVTCRTLVLAQRAARRLPDIRPRTRHVETAAAKGLGVGDPRHIEVVTVTV